MQEDLVSNDAVCRDLHVGEEFLCPIFLDCLTDVRSGNLVGLSDFQSGDVEEIFLVVSFDVVDGQSPQDVALVVGSVADVRFDSDLF